MIIFTKDLLSLNPAYNNSIIQFKSSTLTVPTKAEITTNGYTFPIVPLNGVFTFNFKEIIKSLINKNRFEDSIIPDLTDINFIYNDETISFYLGITIRVFSGHLTDVANKGYLFMRGVEQLPDYHRLSKITANVRCLLPTKNYVDYYCKYFEGYPFDFAIHGLNQYTNIKLKNITTNQVLETSTIAWGTGRYFLSDGANSATEMDELIQSSALNKIEFYANDVFKFNLYIQKVESDCGVYIKWLNSKGAYSYWKFDNIYKSTITPRTIDDFTGRYDNLQNLTSTSHLIGKTANQTLQVTSKYTNEDAIYLSDLTTAPAVWIYVHNEPFQQQQPYDFIGVKISDTAFIALDTKKSKNKINLTITLPALNTITN